MGLFPLPSSSSVIADGDNEKSRDLEATAVETNAFTANSSPSTSSKPRTKPLRKDRVFMFFLLAIVVLVLSALKPTMAMDTDG